MDPNPESFPILSYVMTRLPPVRVRSSSRLSMDSSDQLSTSTPRTPRSSRFSGSTPAGILDQMPHLKDAELIESMKRTITDVAQTNSVLRTLGPRPSQDAVDMARVRLAELETKLYESLEEVVLSPRPRKVNRDNWRVQLVDKEIHIRREAEKERAIYRSILQLDAMHDAYGKLQKEAEERLMAIYNSSGGMANSWEESEEVADLVEEAQGKDLERLDLSNRKLRSLPDSLGNIKGLAMLHLSNNHLQVVPESFGELENLEVLNISSNVLVSLPVSIGRLQKLKILNVSGNKLQAFPNSICLCRSLVELDASINKLVYLPTNFGREQANLQRLFIQLNTIRSLSDSIGAMISLQYLDAHFNHICGLPSSFGRLTHLEVLDLSSNFSALKELPETFGELTSLKELDLSHNQIHALPDTFGSLISLTKLNLEHNPLMIPPKETVEKGVEAVTAFMTKRSLDVLLDEENDQLMFEDAEEGDSDWLISGSSWLTGSISFVKGSLWGFVGAGGSFSGDPYLDEPR